MAILHGLPASKIARCISAFFSRFDRYDSLLFMSMFIYAIVFSYFTCLKHYVFSSYAGDLGIFNQAFYTTIFQGKLFYYTVENYVNPTGCYFAIHFSPILFTLVPFYAVYPTPETLLIAQSFILALGALPLYLIAYEILKDKRPSLVIALAYLLHPALQGANWFDFHSHSFLPLTIFSSHYFLIKRRWAPYFFSILLTLMIAEWTSIVVLALSANLLLIEILKFASISAKRLRKGMGNLNSILTSFKWLKIERGSALALSMILSVVWLFLSWHVKSLYPLDPTFSGFLMATYNWKVLGIESSNFYISIPLQLLSHPDLAYQALLFDYHLKFLYLIFLFAPLLFIPFESKICISALVLLAPFLFSNGRGYYMIGYQNTLIVLPIIFLALVDGISRLNLKKGINLKLLLVSTLLFIINTSPLSPMSHAFLNKTNILSYPHRTLEVDEKVRAMHDLIALIPPNASVLASNSLFPHVSNRLNAYAIPAWGVLKYNPEATTKYLSQLIDKSDYILLITPTSLLENNYVLNVVINDPSFGLYAIGGSALLFKRGYSGEVLDLSPKPYAFLAYKDFILTERASIIKEEGVKDQVVFYSKTLGEGVIIYGPYVVLPPGTYNVTFFMKVLDDVEGHIAWLDVASDFGKALAKRDVYGFEIKAGEWTNISLTLSQTKVRTACEFRVFATGLASLYIDRVIVERLPHSASVDFGTNTFNYKDLKLGSGSIRDGILFHPHNLTAGTFWYGPYRAPPLGAYTATFFIKTSPSPKSDDRILTLDVAYNKGLVLTKLEVSGSSLESINSGWYKVSLSFTLDRELKDVEFRGLNPSSKYDIYLAYILIERLEG